jgi:hypothetical protein
MGWTRLGTLVVLTALVVLCSLPGHAQVLYGTVVGNVTDPSQGAVVKAAVTLAAADIGFQRATVTDDRGWYEFANVPAGNYSVRITAPGFSTFEASGLAVTVNTVARVDAQMKVGAVSETVTVGAEAAVLQTDKTDVSKEISTREITSLPLSGYRNYQSLIDLVPGAMPSRFQNAVSDTPNRSLTTNINGTARNSNNTRIDGATSVMTWLPHHSLYVPAAESIETVNISTNNFDAEQGLAGGAAITVITRSGTNQIHGSAFEYHTNHALGAKNFFFNPNTPAGPSTPQNIQNQYGGTVGGPIRRDKLFYFASWEGTKQRQLFTGLRTVPTQAQRDGNFAGLASVYDPNTGNPDGSGRQPFAGNVIPTTRQNAISRQLQGLVPLPNLAGNTSNFFSSSPLSFNKNLVDGKLNYTINSKIAVFGKYSIMLSPVTSLGAMGGVYGASLVSGGGNSAGIGDSYNRTQIFGAGVNILVTPSFLIDANFGGSRMHHTTQGPDYGTNFGSDVLKIPGTNGPDPRQSGFPIFDITGYDQWGNPNNWSPVVRNDRTYTYVANAGWNRGAHSLRFGVDLIRHEMNHWQPELNSWSPRGRFNFRPGVSSTTGASSGQFNAYASFLMGLPAEMGKSYQFYDPMQTREWQQGYYIRDIWQVTRRLTLTIGSRFEHFPIMNRGQYGIERYDADANKVIIGGRGGNPTAAGTTVKSVLLAPRIGFAYRLGDKTVVRAGYGITNDPYPVSRPLRSPYPAVILNEFIQANTFAPAGSLSTGIPEVVFPDLSQGTLDIPNTIATVTLLPGEFKRGYIQSFNFFVQRQLPGNFNVQAGYAGTRSIHQALTYFELNPGIVPGAGLNGRPLFQKFGVRTSRSAFIPFATNTYNSFQAQLSRRFSRGLYFTSSYTWSKAIGLNSNGSAFTSSGNSDSGLAFYVPSQMPKNRGVLGFDRTQVLTAAATFDLPFGKGKSMLSQGVGGAIAGGWQINALFSAYTGLPFSPYADGASLNAPQNAQVADQVVENVQRLGGIGVGTPYYDRAAFRAVTEARFGTASLNSLRGPGLVNCDLGIFRAFPITERVSIQFRAEAFNFTNTPHFENPGQSNSNNSVNNAGFLYIASALQDQRTIRFGLRLGF